MFTAFKKFVNFYKCYLNVSMTKTLDRLIVFCEYKVLLLIETDFKYDTPVLCAF